MTYATSTPINTPTKYNTIKTDAPDYLLALLLVQIRRSSSFGSPPTPARAQRPRPLTAGTVRFLSGSACLFFCRKKNNNIASPEAAAGTGASPSSPVASRQAPLQGHAQTRSSPTGEPCPHDGPGGRPSKDPHGLFATRAGREAARGVAGRASVVAGGAAPWPRQLLAWLGCASSGRGSCWPGWGAAAGGAACLGVAAWGAAIVAGLTRKHVVDGLLGTSSHGWRCSCSSTSRDSSRHDPGTCSNMDEMIDSCGDFAGRSSGNLCELHIGKWRFQSDAAVVTRRGGHQRKSVVTRGGHQWKSHPRPPA
ncbi:uncharacterized protein [Miscanthus floridulus]|uniref:uncharacterized protein n=1 Tax=Miscanthus floridulus TaxID=154761 RepID=UPI00345B345C